MPRIIAPGVLMTAIFGRPRRLSTPLITPFFSRSVCHASVRKRKFIHMGRMKINTIKLPFPMPRLRRIKARGKDKTRQNAVLARDNRSDKRSAFACSGVRIERTFATVKAPLLSVRP